MHYEEAGSGTPAFVFVHGFSCDLSDWQPQLDALQAKHRVVACDLRGHGRTPGRAEDCSMETYGADLVELIESLAIAPAVLAGHSMGCRVVLEVARTRPELVAGLALIDGSWTGTGDPAAAEKGLQDKVTAMGYAAFVEERAHDMFPAASSHAERLIERTKRLPPAIGGALFPRMSRWDAQYMATTLGGLSAPLIVVQSTYLTPALKRETLQPGQSSPWLDHVRTAVPHARIEIVPGVSHFVQLDAADKVNQLLGTFAASV
jgi:pimeloyl-ACP methyl ester carboxylesterase